MSKYEMNLDKFPNREEDTFERLQTIVQEKGESLKPHKKNG